MPHFAAADTIARRPPRRGWIVAAAVFGPIAIRALLEWLGPEGSDYLPHLGLFVLAEALFFFLSPAILPQGFWAGERRGRVAADASGLSRDGTRLLARDEIVGQTVELQTDGTRVVRLLARKARRDVEVMLPDDERVRALLEALSLEPARRAVRLSVLRAPLRSPARRFGATLRWCIGGLAVAASIAWIALTRHADPLLFAIMPALLLYGFVTKKLASRADVLLGADGFSVRLPGAARSISLSEVASVRGRARDIEVELRSGERLLLRVADDVASKARGESALALLEECLAQSRREGAQALGAHLSRGGRGATEWLESLRALRAGSETAFRVASTPEETLWNVVEDVRAEASARVGAAMALRATLDDAGRRRLRAIAEASALEEVRDALYAMLEGDEDEAIARRFARDDDG